jgi:hypothetical protein
MSASVERRGVVRLTIRGGLPTRVRPTREVRLLDLSPFGARIEHGTPLQPGVPYVLDLAPDLGGLPLAAEIVWTTRMGEAQIPEGEGRLRYQSGLVFLSLMRGQRAALGRFLEGLTTAA